MWNWDLFGHGFDPIRVGVEEFWWYFHSCPIPFRTCPQFDSDWFDASRGPQFFFFRREDGAHITCPCTHPRQRFKREKKKNGKLDPHVNVWDHGTTPKSLTPKARVYRRKMRRKAVGNWNLFSFFHTHGELNKI